jgi:hypothetical protein
MNQVPIAANHSGRVARGLGTSSAPVRPAARTAVHRSRCLRRSASVDVEIITGEDAFTDCRQEELLVRVEAIMLRRGPGVKAPLELFLADYLPCSSAGPLGLADEF